jgi:hypothetical protein
MIRKIFIELYKKSHTPPSQDEVASYAGITIDDLRQRLECEPRLPNLHDISFSDARMLIDHYGPELLFGESAESDVKAYFANRAKIEAFEKKAKRKSHPPPPSDEK